MLEMNSWMKHTVQVISDSASSGDYMKMGLNAILLWRYIDANLPEMRSLVYGATTKQAAAQEYVSYLEDLRTGTDLVVQAEDKYNAGEYAQSSSLFSEASSYLGKANVHQKTYTSLL